MANKLAFFPTPYHDEILYSIFNRYHYWNNDKYYTDSIEDLFGHKTISIKLAFPSHMNNLYERLPEGTLHTPKKLIDNHSLYPLFKPFLSKEKNKTVINDMIYSPNLKATHLTGFNQSVIPKPAYYRVCKSCYTEDLRNFGEAILRRTHQVSGVHVCPHHGSALTETKISTYAIKSNLSVFSPIDESVFNSDLIIIGSSQHHSKFANQIYWILNNEIPIIVQEEIYSRYSFFLREKNLMTFNGTIKEQKFIKGFLSYYGEEFLTSMNSSVKINDRNNWITEAFRRKKNLHPIRHLLLINFLGIDVKEFFLKDIVPYQPFGKGPWICFNAASNHFFEETIIKCEIKRGTNSGAPTGTFSCDCGFIYSRQGPDKTDSDKYKVGKVINYGSIWENRLFELRYEKKMTIKDIACELNVTPLTVIRKLKKKNNMLHEEKLEIKDSNDKREMYRNFWKKSVELNPNKSKTELRLIAKAEYMWLYRHDRKWLEENSPKKTKRKPFKNMVDWAKRDKEYLNLIKFAVEQILAEEERPKRITNSLIGSKIGKNHIFQYGLSNLPLSKEYMESVTETIEEIRMRRISWAAQELKKQGKPLSFSNIRKKASLSTPDLNIVLIESINKELFK